MVLCRSIRLLAAAGAVWCAISVAPGPASCAELQPGSLAGGGPGAGYRLHKGLAWAGAAGLLALAAIVLLLLRQRRSGRRAEAELWASSQMLQLVLENMPAFVFWKDRKSVYLGCNRLFAANAGLKSTEEIKGLTDLDLPWKRAEAESYRADDQQVMTTGIPKINYEETQSTADGRLTEVRTSKIPLRDARGGVIGVLGTFEDITERKKAERELQAANRRFSEIIEFLPDATFVIDKEKKVIAWNRAIEKMTGVPKEEMLGKGDFAYGVPWYGERRPILIDLIGMPNAEIERKYEYVLKSPDGTLYAEVFVPRLNRGQGAHVWVAASPLMGADGKLYGAIESVRDVTARRRAEELLAESEDKFKTLSERSQVGIYLIQDGLFRYVNPAMAAFFGYKVEEMVGKKGPKDMIYREDLPLVLENLRKRLDGEVPFVNYGFRCVKKNGEVFYGEAYGAKTVFAGKPAAIGTMMDVTERKKAQADILRLNAELEKRVEERTAQLEDANKELEAFSYSAAHDMKAPLRRLNIFAEMLETEAGQGLKDSARSYLLNIRKSATQMSKLVDGLLALSTTGKRPLEPGLVPLGGLLQEAIAETRAETAGREIEWKTAELPEATCDRAMIKQVFLNLLGNAAKYSRGRAPARIEVLYSRRGAEHVIGVRDNGVGFSPDYADRLFGVFQRLHKAEDFEGSGIGLSTVKRIVSRHGGRVWAESSPGEGAVFYFTLPA
ncbi:MAG: PAS domain S-box protein [Elusimicrobiales bacterium]|nr:PAS domain S-box protein [Elusimicrobiales bacterium]